MASPRHKATFKFRNGPLFSETSETSPSSPSPAPNTNIVPVDKENIENAAAVTGGILGLVLTGPVGAVVLAALTNYVVKKENDSGEALRYEIPLNFEFLDSFVLCEYSSMSLINQHLPNK